MDNVGPAQVHSVGGKWYVLVILDDFSLYSWVYFIETKDEAFGFVRDLILRLKNEPYDPIIAIHNDNGMEFKNAHFETFCSDLGLEHQFSSPYVPPQNGIVERKNLTIFEKGRTMLDEHRTPRKYWAEAVNTGCYISNWIFLSALLKKTFDELMHHRAPNVSHLRTFRCRCFILKQGNLDKFESHSSNGIFLGYAAHSRAYRVLNLKTNRVIETCETTFDETMPRTTPAFECADEQELGQDIFEEEEEDADDGANDDGIDHVPADPPVHSTSTTFVDGPYTSCTTPGHHHEPLLDQVEEEVQDDPAEVEGEATLESQGLI